jgi:primosomal protein N'
VAYEAGILTLAAFNHWQDLFSRTPVLRREFQKCLVNNRTSHAGTVVWCKIVIPSLRSDFSDRFLDIADDGLVVIHESIRACEILSEIVFAEVPPATPPKNIADSPDQTRRPGGQGVAMEEVTDSAKNRVAQQNANSVRRGMPKAEANIKAREFLRKKPKATARELSVGIGCSLGLISQLPAWKAVQEERAKDRKPKKAAEVSLTPKLEGSLGQENNPLDALIDEQREDFEPSPLEKDPLIDSDRDGAPRTRKIYRKPSHRQRRR